MAKKYIKTTAKNAVKKGLIKEGDKVWIEVDVLEVYKNEILVGTLEAAQFFAGETKIRIPKPEPKRIDFGVAGRVLKRVENSTIVMIVMTTGLDDDNSFSGYILESDVYKKGHSNNNWAKKAKWQDITETYKPES